MSNNQELSESGRFVRSRTREILDTLEATLESRRQEAGFDNARADVLAIVMCVLEATTFYLGENPGRINEFMAVGTLYRMTGKTMPEFKFSPDAEVDLLVTLVLDSAMVEVQKFADK